jgi:hypothetical protein
MDGWVDGWMPSPAPSKGSRMLRGQGIHGCMDGDYISSLWLPYKIPQARDLNRHSFSHSPEGWKSKIKVLAGCGPSYSGSRDQEDRGLKPAWANRSGDPIKKPNTKKGWQSGSSVRVPA